jgi:hypothetical protein
MDENFLINLFFRRTPRRKLVFSSSDDETDDSPQSGRNSFRFNSKIQFSFFFFSVHNLRQEHQDEQ